MTCAELKEVLDLYLDGELEPGRRPRLEAHAGRCAACARELEKRRGLDAALRGAFDRSLEVAEPPGGERERLVERMVRAARGRLTFPARLAAAAVIGVALGLVAYSLGLSRATPDELALAESLRDREARDAQIRRLRNEAEADLRFVRDAVKTEKQEDPAALAVSVAAATIARKLEPGAGPPPDAAAARERRLVVKDVVEGVAVELAQMGDGRVTLVLPDRTVEAPSMAELQKRYAELCRKFGVQGREGAVRVGGNVAATDLKGRLHLSWRTGIWDEDLHWEAARSWMSGRIPDAAEMERHFREMQERYKAASAPATVPEVKVDLASILAEVKGRSRRELEEARERVRREMERLEREFEELRELRGRAKGLRTFAEAVTAPADRR